MLSLRAVARRNGSFHQAKQASWTSTRHLRTRTVTDGDISRLAAKPLHPLTLADLCKHGRPPLSKKDLLKSANFTLDILPSRLAHRIQSLRALPYIVVANPNVSKIHGNYMHSLSTLLPYAERKIDSLEEEIHFTEAMADLVNTHGNTIAILARGFLEARKYISKDEITRFLDEHLRARIGTRLIAEQHIALHFSSKPHNDLADHAELEEEEQSRSHSYIGVIDTALQPANIIRSCEHTVGEICELKYGVRPSITLVGNPRTTIAHIPMHLEYILTELLKNSFRATIEAGMEREPIEVTIAPAPASPKQQKDAFEPSSSSSSSPPSSSKSKSEQPKSPPPSASEKQRPAVAGISNFDQGNVDYASGSNRPDKAGSANIRPLDEQTPGVTIRIRDRGGGISPENYTKLWEYGFTTFNEDEIHEKVSGGAGVSALDAISGGVAGGSSLAGLGYGLPLGRAYAEYFGGGIAVQSLWGWGTDVYLSLRGVGKVS